MNIAKKFLKVLKYVLGLYVASVLLMFLLGAIEVGPIGAAWMTDDLMVRGVVKRILHPITSDKQMIANFQAKRADFEKIIQINNEVCLKDAAYAKSDYQENKEIGLLIKKLGLISFSPREGTLWLANPYSVESKKKQDALKKEYELSQYSDNFRKKMCPYYSLEFIWEESSNLFTYKGLAYFPEEPMLKDGKIIEPRDFFNPPPHNPRDEKGMLDTLIGKIFSVSGICQNQKIDKNWFIFTCEI